jgi:DNA polymerase III delta prime subunit
MAEQEEYTDSIQKNVLVSAPWWVRLCKVLWKISGFMGTGVVVGLVVGVASFWLTSSRGELPADSPLNWLLAQWPITVLVGSCLLLIALLTFVLSRWESRATIPNEQAPGTHGAVERQTTSARPDPRLSSLDRQNRQRLLKRVRQIWIEGVLKHSLYQSTLIALDLQERPDILANPWQLAVQETNLPPRPLPAGTSIAQVYDEADGELLILGEPGAGKTTLLLELARTLLDRADKGAKKDEEHEHLPVVFNLSSWAQKRRSLADWLVEELSTKYEVPPKVGKVWIDTDSVLPLLDGLDEVAEDARPACVQAIIAYRRDCLQKSGTASLVICCRSQEYMALSTRVALHRAVSIQPLTSEQIERYLQSAGDQLGALRHALQNDSELYELAHQPLMLNIFTLAYQGATPEDLPTEGDREARKQQVFATYVKNMFIRRGAAKRFSRESAQRWLTFLAARMQQHHQTGSGFYLEQLQPDWLSGKLKALYHLSVALIVGLVVGLVSGLAFVLLTNPLSGLLSGLFFGLLSALLIGLPGSQLTERLHFFPNKGIWRSANYGLFIGLIIGLVIGLLVGLLDGLLAGLLDGLLFGLIGAGVGWVVLRESTGMIQPAETVPWSWRKARPFLIFGLLIPALLGLIVGLLAGKLVVGLTLGLVVGLPLGLLGGLSSKQLPERSQLAPNEGIWRSARNGLSSGLTGGLSIGLVFGVLALGQPLLSSDDLAAGLAYWVVYGLVLGVVIGLIFGLSAFLEHFTLRFWLYRKGHLPWNLVAFLDEMAERLLLRKVGGGYIFVHRLLLDYFASLEKKVP